MLGSYPPTPTPEAFGMNMPFSLQRFNKTKELLIGEVVLIRYRRSSSHRLVWPLMLIFVSCLRDGVKMSETSKGIVGDSLNDLAQQGVIEQNKVDSFSTPLYIAEECEMRHIIEENSKYPGF